MQKGIKFRIYPNREQKNFIHQTLGCCRLIYNRGLAMRKESYEEGKKIGYTQTSAMLTELKRQEEFAFLKAADSIALQQSLRDLDQSFVNFFQKRASYPTFKSKHNRFQSYRTVNQKDNIRIVGRYIKLPKLGFVKIRQNHAQMLEERLELMSESKHSILTAMEIRYQIPDIWNAPCENS